jgi:hypothetical protein
MPKKEPISQWISLLPMGQTKADLKTAAKTVAQLKNEWTLSTIVSFEVWAAATCYDPEAEHGGDVFQALMGWVLTDAKRGNVDGVGNSLDGWHFHTDGSNQLVNNDHSYPNGTLYAALSQGYKKRPGGEQQAGASSNKRGFDYNWSNAKNEGKDRNEKALKLRDLQPGSGASRPDGRMCFYESCGLSRFMEVNGKPGAECEAKNQSRQFVGGKGENQSTETNNSAGSKDESQTNGCMNVGNRLAAFYGLYFYRDCEKPAWNWVEYCPAQGKVYKVRMRLPNPAYEIVKGSDGTPRRLRVNEPAIGGGLLAKTGFYFPKLYQRTNWDQIAHVITDSKGVPEDYIITMRSPWAGQPLKDGGDVTVQWAEMPKNGELQSARVLDDLFAFFKDKFNGRVHRREDASIGRGIQQGGLAFGWSLPTALFLYPHEGSKGGAAKGAVEPPMYQPWPGWRNGESKAKFDKEDYGKDRPFVWHLELAPKWYERQKFVLGFAKYDTVTDNGPALFNELTKQPKEPAVPVTAPPAVADPSTAAQKAVTVPGKKALEKAVFVFQDELGTPAAPDDNDDLELVARDSVVEVNNEWEPDQTMSYMEAEGDPDNFEDRPQPKGGLYALWAQNNTQIAKEPLEPGAERRKKEKAGNTHFYSSNFQPWRWEDVYERPEHGWRVGGQMKPDEIKEYEAKYGNTANLLLRTTLPSRLEPPTNNFGDPSVINGERILDMRLDSYRTATDPEVKELFEKNMRRILSIYFDDSGGLGLGAKIKTGQKQEGMLNGIWMKKGRAFECCPEVKYSQPKGDKGLERIFPPVFDKEPPVDGVHFVNNGEIYRGSKSGYISNAFRTADVSKVESSMTVLEWLQSPWHYEYLPFQPKTSVFKDGENFCAGCTRCARPFYEYEELYSSYHFTDWPTQHFPYIYWRAGPVSKHDYRFAPLPFHEKSFWSTNVVQGAGGKKKPSGQYYDAYEEGETPTQSDGSGYHNWPTHAFLLGAHEEGKGKKVVHGGGPLAWEWQKRATRICPTSVVNCGAEELKETWKKKEFFTFRKYINHAWLNPELNLPINVGKDLLFQGCVRTKGAKVAYGMRQYKLMRSVKYGNVCRDCMATLDLAPGLYERTGRVSAHLSLIDGGQTRPGASLDTWWLALRNTQLLRAGKPITDEDGKPVLFNPWFIYVQTGGQQKRTEGKARSVVRKELGLNATEAKQLIEARTKTAQYKLIFGKGWEQMLDAHMEAVTAMTRQRSCELKVGDFDVTRIHKPPEVFVQKTWTPESDKWAKLGEEGMESATKVMQKLTKWLQDSYEGEDVPFPTLPKLNPAANRALFDILKDTHYNLAHLHAYKRERTTPQFDPDLERVEWRNYKQGAYNNCLMTKQLVKPETTDRQTRKVSEGRHKTLEYLYDVKTKKGDSDWRGDQFVIKGGPSKQIRSLTQTRVFITYSLHRRVSGDLEARGICEKMADALRAIFGNDQELCRIIIFGMKLADVAGDSVSRKAFVPIKAARKEEKTFYGNKDAKGAEPVNSYVYDTYQTHIESIDVDAGVEIGPTLHHPHFHLLLTINHWSYVQVDTMRMRCILEQMFKGVHWKHGEEFMLLDQSGLPFYTDNEVPYVDIRLYPTDNWADVISGYIRKGSDKETMAALRARTGENPANF